MNEQKIEAIIFDLDGVLVSTDKYHYQAWKKMADEIGVYFDEEINNRLRGISRMESLDIILEGSGQKFSKQEKKQLAERKNEYYRNFLAELKPSDVQESVRQTLQILKELEYYLAVGSSSKNAKYILNRIGLTDVFDAISDGTNISKSKPDPEVFQKAAEFMKKAAEYCIVVEDACAGIDAAKAAGMRSIGIGEAAKYVHTDYPIQQFEEIVDVLNVI